MHIALSQSPEQDSFSSSSTIFNASTDAKDTHQSHRKSRCQPDLFDRSIKCTSKDIGDDRQCISHFFGRNKKGTASIPPEYFPVLCRKHYQERYYRWSDDPGLYAGYQCDSILQVLEKMQVRQFRDGNGIEWPWYCGVHLCLSNRGKHEQLSNTAPDWLRALSIPSSNAMLPSSSLSIYTQARYSLPQLIQIVNGIKTWCLQNNEQLPSFEALPITIGMQDLYSLDIARKYLRQSEGKRNLAYKVRKRLQSGNNNDVVYDLKTSVRLQMMIQEAEAAKDAAKLAVLDATETCETVPSKRQPNMRSEVSKSKSR